MNPEPDIPAGAQSYDVVVLSRRLLHLANEGVSRVEFLREVTNLLLDTTGCDGLEIHLVDPDRRIRWEAGRMPLAYQRLQVTQDPVTCGPEADAGSDLDVLCETVLAGDIDPSAPCFTKGGSFWTDDATSPGIRGTFGALVPWNPGRPGEIAGALAVIPFEVAEQSRGTLVLHAARSGTMDPVRIGMYEQAAQAMALAGSDRRAQWALRERVKELTCLYGISKQSEDKDAPLDQTLQCIVELLPAAWQFPGIASARIRVDGADYATPGFREGPWRQTAPILIDGAARGSVEVSYAEERPEFVEGAFLSDEQHLIDTIAREIALIVRRKQAEGDRARLHDQLRHADRLATIGQLAAGVAHEINEPLGSVLGFAQLSQKAPGLPEQVASDLQKVVAAALHAREIIRKLLIFARQMPPRKAPVDLAAVVSDGLAFLEPRCARAGVRLEVRHAAGLPPIVADPAQIQQIVVNLAVNAVQAMPLGGTLTVETASIEGGLLLAVEDTGAGMTEEVQRQIFTPFFTTKEVGQGTGLGLPVVHGIVSSHGGSIRVSSALGRGSRFEVRLPSGGG